MPPNVDIAADVRMRDSSGPQKVLDALCCPRCHGLLKSSNESITCAGCGSVYPIIDQIPVLICEDRSVFQHSDFCGRGGTFFTKEGRLRRLLFSLVPTMNTNRIARHNYAKLCDLLLQTSVRPRVLIIGGSILGEGMAEFRARTDIDFIDTDVSFGPMTKAICDAHDLPVPDQSIDAVILQAVLEHVADPYRCVDEVDRVLKDSGFVYAETPFMQPAHATPYDFQRFTFIGYRRLFRRFDQIAIGPVGGPGQAIGQQYENAMLCLTSNRAARAIIYLLTRWTAFWLKYLDRLMNRNPHAIHCASALFFLGRKSGHILSDREVIDVCRQLC